MGLNSEVAKTICPPSTHYEPFDSSQFAMRGAMPVSASYRGLGEWASPGLDFCDYSRATTQTRKLFNGRRFAVPTWALNNSQLQNVVCETLFRRVNYAARSRRVPEVLTERMLFAEELVRARVPTLEKEIDELCAEYVSIKKARVSHAYVRTLEAQIRNLDTSIIIDRSPARVICTVIYKYFREGLSSSTVADATGLTAPGVRQLIFRISRIARNLGYEIPARIARCSSVVAERDRQLHNEDDSQQQV